jgi:hypothetical protein
VVHPFSVDHVVFVGVIELMVNVWHIWQVGMTTMRSPVAIVPVAVHDTVGPGVARLLHPNFGVGVMVAEHGEDNSRAMKRRLLTPTKR